MKILAALLGVLISSAAAQPRGVILGSVTDRSTLTPLEGATVRVEGTSRGMSTRTDGSFLLGGLANGSYTITASYVGYRDSSVEVRIGTTDSLRVHFALEPVIIVGQPITVTASKGRERETPAAFSTLDRQEIRERYTTQDVPVLLSALPSVTYYSESGNGIGYTYLTIRGFDARRVAVLVNGIPQNDPEDHNVYWLDMPDLPANLEEIQVQRGATGAFFGPPAIGGSVNLETANFARERTLSLSAGVGSYNTRKYAAAFSSGMIDGQYAFHGRLARLLSSGYRDHAWVDFSSYFLGAVRYDNTMTTQVNFYGGPIADGLTYVGIPKADVTDLSQRRKNPILRPEEQENFSQPHYELLHEWRLSEHVRLNNAFFLVTGDGFFDYDGSWAPYAYFRITRENGFDVTGDPDTLFLPDALIRAQVTNTQYGWLPRVTVRHTNGELVAGGELRIHRSDHWGRLQFSQQLPEGVGADYRYYWYKGAKDIASLYIQEQYKPNSSTNLMVSLQYVYNRYRLYDEKFVGTDFAVPYHFLNPRVGVNYNVNDHWNLFASAAYTSREPRLKNLYDAAEASTPASWGAVLPQFAAGPDGKPDVANPLVTPESLFDVELGAGVTGSGGSASVNAYWMEFTDEIVKSGQLDRFGQPVTGNADRTRHLGVEVSAQASLTGGLSVQGNLTLSRNRLTRYTVYTATDTGAMAIQLDGNPIAGFPDILGNLRCTYHTGDATLGVSGRYAGRQYTDNLQDVERSIEPYVVCDAWASYRVPRFMNSVGFVLTLQVNNLFDTLYAAGGEGDQFFVGAERNVFFNILLDL